MLSKRLAPAIEETMQGLYNAMAAIGVLIVTGLGGYLGLKYSVNAPFLMVGCFDLCFVTVLLFLRYLGKKLPTD